MCERYRLSRRAEVLAAYDADYEGVDWEARYNIAPTLKKVVPRAATIVRDVFLGWEPLRKVEASHGSKCCCSFFQQAVYSVWLPCHINAELRNDLLVSGSFAMSRSGRTQCLKVS